MSESPTEMSVVRSGVLTGWLGWSMTARGGCEMS